MWLIKAFVIILTVHEKVLQLDERFTRGRVLVDPLAQLAIVDNRMIHLAPREVNVMWFLSETFISCEELCERFFYQKGEIVNHDTAYIHIGRLKKKLPEGTLETHQYRGYRIKPQLN